MKQSPSREANKSSASQEISRILWNAEVLYRTHKCQSFVHILSQMSPVHASPSHCLKIHFIIIIRPFKSRSSKFSFSLRTSDQYYVWTSPFSNRCLIPRLSRSSWFGHPYNIWWGVQIIITAPYVVFSSPLLSRQSWVKDLPQYPVIKHKQPVLLPHCGIDKLHTHKKKRNQAELQFYVFEFYNFGYKPGRQILCIKW